MRAVAATAVVIVHALGPYRDRVGEMNDFDWSSVIALNGALRWSVPIFILITGALLLSDTRPFALSHFLRRRVLKVLVPFLAFSVAYAVLAGVSARGFDPQLSWQLIRMLPSEETYYHLGFFYYFIPLYLLIPLLRPLLSMPTIGVLLACGWLVLAAMRLAGMSGPWDVDLVMYGGYLVFGWLLWRYRPPLTLVLILALVSIIASDWLVIEKSLDANRYRTGLYLSYKTINTAIAASAVFLACIALTARLGDGSMRAMRAVARHSLGIFLLHPLFLWPARAFDLYASPGLLFVFFWALVAGGLAYAGSVLLSRSPTTRWLVPS